MNSATVLALETSCDETAVAILRGKDLLASEVASQSEHGLYGGVVPEVASRNHLLHAPRLLADAVKKAEIALDKVDAFAATAGPGLASSLMIGASIAKGLAIGFAKPYLAINHLEGHLLSPFFSDNFEIEPNVSLIASGGHTLLIEVRALNEYHILGRTVDDAAGEAFDKVAKMLGLTYPGGPEIEKRARGGDPKRFNLPRSMLDSENFSFSGLKTAVRYLLPKLQGDYLADLCASFQQAVVDVLVRKTIAAVKKHRIHLVTLSGGVSCNEELRRQLREACERNGFQCKSAEPWLCTDNAAMIAFAASLRLRDGFVSHVADEIDPNLALPSTRA
ncbi:MAG: tRNA (adenosine(37)-N6)-threonylcarbamoyltransferase complex transferase subunit TsaD [Verrucomicrobiota bacterium]